jgi:GDP-4-dehydro-6-deoxy-D-mannose reductase
VTVALVTGSHGFVGTHLRKELAGRGWTVVGLGRSVRRAGDAEQYVRADLTSQDEVVTALESVRPDVVFHLAATPGARASGEVTSVVAATYALCSALVTTGQHPRVVLAGSSAQYGALRRDENPVTEDSRFQPVGAYGLAKAAAEYTARAFAAGGTFEVVPVRAFNHVGPGEPPTTVASALARRVADVLAGHADTVTVADLEAVRDFTDVRDIARGYADLAERAVPGRPYNLCSGRATTVADVLDGLLAAAGLDRSVVRPLPTAPLASGTISYQVGCPRRTRDEIGWETTRELADSLRGLLEEVQRDSGR